MPVARVMTTAFNLLRPSTQLVGSSVGVLKDLTGVQIWPPCTNSTNKQASQVENRRDTTDHGGPTMIANDHLSIRCSMPERAVSERSTHGMLSDRQMKSDSGQSA